MEQCAGMSDRTIDERVIEACRNGDREAFRLLFEAYKDRVYSIALHFTGEETAARDVTQQVFLKLMTKIDQYHSHAGFTTWLYRLVANTCMDEHRRASRFVFFGDTTGVEVFEARPSASASNEERLLRREIADEVKAAVADLKPKLRIAVLLRYFEDLSYEEMASALGCSKGTVASRLNRGHAILARKLARLRGAIAVGEE
jgi:RNA polymerase sigma-70 factor (ECF subfamily)